MSYSSRKPYSRLKQSQPQFFRASTRHLKDTLGAESVFEKPYVTEEYGDMHQSLNTPVVAPPVAGGGVLGCLFSANECEIDAECFAGAEILTTGGPEEATAGYEEPEIIEGGLANWTVDDSGRLIHLVFDTNVGRNIIRVSFKDGWGNIWSELVQVVCQAPIVIGVPVYAYANEYLTSDFLNADQESGGDIHILAAHANFAGGDGAVVHIWGRYTSWQSEVIEYVVSGLVRDHTGLVVDSNDDVHVVYDAVGGITYGKKSGGSWSTTIVSATGGGGNDGLIIDSNDKAHIIYYDTDGDTKHATNATGSWQIEVVFTGPSSEIATDIKSDDTIVFTYERSDVLYCYEGSWGSWSSTSWSYVAHAIGYPAVAIDSNDKIYIFFSYIDSGDDEDSMDVLQRTDATGSWVESTVISEGVKLYNLYAHIDSQDYIHLMVSNNDDGDPHYYSNKSGSWAGKAIGWRGSGAYYPVVFFQNDPAEIVYFHQGDISGPVVIGIDYLQENHPT